MLNRLNGNQHGNHSLYIDRILHDCSCIIKFSKQVGEKEIKCEALPSILSFFTKSLINSIIQEQECKILYRNHGSSVVRHLPLVLEVPGSITAQGEENFGVRTCFF